MLKAKDVVVKLSCISDEKEKATALYEMFKEQEIELLKTRGASVSALKGIRSELFNFLRAVKVRGNEWVNPDWANKELNPKIRALKVGA